MAEEYTVNFNLLQDATRTASGQGAGNINALNDSIQNKKNNQAAAGQRQKNLFALLGINVTLAALLKNSQIFTNTLGAFFQIVGGAFDLILAPLAPLFASGLAAMANLLPVIAQVSQATLPRLVDSFRAVGQILGSIAGALGNLFRPVINLFDKDGVSADGRLRLSDIIAGLGSAVLGAGIFRALQTGSKTVVTATVGSLMQGTIGKLTGFIKGVSFISLIFSGLSIANIFETSGIKAGIIALADFMIATIFASLGAILGGLATAGSPIGVILGGVLGGLGYQKFISPRIFGGDGGMRAPGSFIAGDSAPAPPARAETYDRALAFPVSDTASFVSSGNTNLYDYDRAVGRSMAGR